MAGRQLAQAGGLDAGEGVSLTIVKAELHCHIEGAAPPDLVQQKANRYGVDLDGIISDDGQSYVWSDFSEFLIAFDRVASLFRTEQDYSDLAYRYYCDLADMDCIYCEVFVSADHAESSGLGYPAYLRGLADGFERARDERGIEGRFIPVAIRHLGPENATKSIETVVANPHPLVTGFGMAGDERLHAPADFRRAFDIAKDAGLRLTVHAGEVCGARSIRDALDAVPVARIGHGVRAIEDADLVRRIADTGIVLEVCPGSNVALGVFDSRLKHSLQDLIEAGCKTTLNSDDPPFFRTSLDMEYRETQSTLGYSDAKMLKFTENAIEAAFVDDTTRKNLLERLRENGSS